MSHHPNEDALLDALIAAKAEKFATAAYAAELQDTLTFERQANEKNCAELLAALATLARVRDLCPHGCLEYDDGTAPCKICAALDGGDQ